jgi:hypothetical protein
VCESPPCGGNEGAEVAVGSQDIRVEAGDCPEKAYFGP